MFSNISNQKLVLFFTIILIALCPFVYYLWDNEILGIGNWGRKRKDSFEDKNCSTEIEHAIEEHKRKNKEKKEAKEKRLAPGRVKISTYDVNNENYLLGDVEEIQPNLPGYLTKETAYPFDCEPDDKSNRWL